MLNVKPYYGVFGGAYVFESLVAPLCEVERAFIHFASDKKFQNEMADLLSNYAGRPTPITHAKNLSAIAGCSIYLKREDLLHGGAHKTNNTIGQCLLAKYMGKKRVIAETGAGQHGVATAMVGALLGLKVEIYMGKVDMERQIANVERMKLFGATVHEVTAGSQTLKDAVNEALRDWIASCEDTLYVFGTAAGPHPFPSMVRYFQSVIGIEAKQQMQERINQLPTAVFACVGGGSNAIGIFSAFIDEPQVQLFGAEAAGHGFPYDDEEEEDEEDIHCLHAATLEYGSVGVFHGMKSLFLQTSEGQISETHSVSAGLDYPGVGPEHAYLQEIKRVTYLGITDDEALDTYELLAKREGIIGALESCHAVALAMQQAKNFTKDSNILINLSGRGDKDLNTYMEMRG